MRRDFLTLLRDPVSHQPLSLVAPSASGDIIDGVLTSPDGREYPITNGIARLTSDSAADRGQAQTASSFDFKWDSWRQHESQAAREMVAEWAITRYFDDAGSMRAYVNSRRRILDAGCGSGFTSQVYLPDDFSGELWMGVDISGAIDAAQARLGHIPNTCFVQADMLHLPLGDPGFDMIFAEGSMHHTPSTRLAFDSLAGQLAPGGDLLFYVYRTKAPLREYADDYVRDRIAPMSPEDALSAVEPLTQLGKALHDLHATVEVPDVPLLGIPAGRYDVQRLFYWHVAKVYWNAKLSFEENNHVNLDWYHPRYAHRQTEDEVRAWCKDAGLTVERFHVDDPGFTVRAHRPA